MNLSTARSEKRAREVGIRKTMGSRRGQLIGQFYSESMLLSLAGGVLAVGLVALLLPFFNQVADKEMVLLWELRPFGPLSSGFACSQALWLVVIRHSICLPLRL